MLRCYLQRRGRASVCTLQPLAFRCTACIPLFVLLTRWISLTTSAGVTMPVVSRFYGIVVFLNYNDHNPPHFHARYQDQEVIVEIQSGLVTGTMSKRALQLLFDWTEQHQDELMEN